MAILARVVLVLSLAVSAAAQGTNGTLTGTVTDNQGGVLPGVTVTVRNVETGTVRTVVTEADGQYRVPALLPWALVAGCAVANCAVPARTHRRRSRRPLRRPAMDVRAHPVHRLDVAAPERFRVYRRAW